MNKNEIENCINFLNGIDSTGRMNNFVKIKNRSKKNFFHHSFHMGKIVPPEGLCEGLKNF